ncbi:MAG: baseplate J/gp47 family protein [Bacteroidia bacterium]|nr:baseplate J/gp47 family protein [Bacteroidia bacterium]
MNSATLLRHPLQHDGTSRRRRLIGALLPQHAPIDERGTADLLLYAEEYARLLQFHDLDGRTDGDWSGLFGRDASVLAALLLKREQAAAYEAQFRPWAEQLENQTGTADIRVPLRQILELMLRMAVRLTDWRAQAAEGLSLSADLDRLLRTVTGDGFYRLLAYLREASAQGVFAPGELPLDQYEAAWPLAVPAQGFAPLRAGLVLDADAAFRESRALRQVFNAFHGVYVQLLARAEAYLEETLTAYPAHEPHMALFLAFVQLLAEPRAQLNRLTKQHLDFYFRDVLRLSPKRAVFDQVHLVLELADGFTRGLLSAEDRIQDGTDPSGNDVFFRPNEELALTPALLDPEEGLKTLFLDKQALAGGAAGQYAVRNAYGSPDADGDARKSADGKWFPLGTPQDPAARFGFAIASPMFLLAEGEREVTLRLRMEGLGAIAERYGLSTIKSELQNNIEIWLSGAESWIPVALTARNADVELLGPAELLPGEAEAAAIADMIVTLNLGPEVPAIVPYTAALNGLAPVPDALDTPYPVACFLFNNFGLSTLGNIDLNLAGNVKRFNSSQIYLEGELALGDPPVVGTPQQLFQARAESLGISPASGTKIWLPLPGSVALSYPVDAGTVVTQSGKQYVALARLEASNAVSPISGSLSKIWAELDQGQGTFNPKARYQTGDAVSFDNNIYKALTVIEHIAPGSSLTGQLNPDWKPIPSYVPPGSPPSAPYEFNDFFLYQSKVYRLIAEEAPFGPDANVLVWEDADIQTFTPGSVYEAGDLVAYNSSLYRLSSAPGPATPKRKTSAAPGTPVSQIWQPIPGYAAAPAVYAQDSLIWEDVAGTIKIFKAQRAFQLVTVTPAGPNYDNSALLKPSRQSRVWSTVEIFDSNALYDEGLFVYTLSTSGVYTFYYRRESTGTNNPLTHSSWRNLGTYDSSVSPAVFTNHVKGNWVPGTAYSFPEVVWYNTGFFAANVNGVLSVDPNNLLMGQNFFLWGEQTSAQNAVSPYSNIVPYGENRFVSFLLNGVTGYYRSGYANQQIPPQPGNIDVWSFVQAAGANSYTSANFPQNIIFAANSIIQFDQQYYIASVDIQAVMPSEGLLAWNEAQILGDYDFLTLYPQFSVVEWESQLYYAAVSISRLAPSHPSSAAVWDAGAGIEAYDAAASYVRGNIVSVADTFYVAQATVQSVHPELGWSIWEKILAPVPEYNDKQPYAAGAYVRSGTVIYRANVPSTGALPQSHLPVWVTLAAIQLYDPSTSYTPGDYVQFGGEIYRALQPLSGQIYSPFNAPELWQRAGEILDHNPLKAYFSNALVKGANGRIYTALDAIDAGNQLSDPNWAEVPYSYPYKYFIDTRLTRASIGVSVSGMRNLILENDGGVINSTKPFMPFTAQPVIGSRFYIGSYEVFSKSVQRLSLLVEWGNLPVPDAGSPIFGETYAKYSENYSSTNLPSSALTIGNDYFTAAALLLGDAQWSTVLPTVKLFESSAGTDTPNPIEFQVVFDLNEFPRKPDLPAFSQLSPSLQRGFMALKLNQDFFHSLYPTRLAQVALATPPVPANIPNPPYTPLINSLTLSYAASETLVFKDKTKGDFEDRIEQFFHLHPYGWAEFVPVDEALDDGQGVLATRELVPRYLAQAGNAAGSAGAFDAEGEALLRDAAGNLFIGIQDLQPPQVLTLLFQVAEGSENPARAKRFVSWSYLADNRWHRFEPAQILSDDTNGLLRPGIVKLSVPSGATGHNTLLPGGRFWLRASVTEDPDGIGFVYDVRIHAVKATFENSGNDLSRLASPLPAESLTGLFFSKAEIQQVAQPFASFGGSLEEQDEAFYIRVSERLRHKQRAVSVFDYERLVLAQFPQVYQVKCITHTEPLPAPAGTQTWNGAYLADLLSQGIEYRPGHVQVIVLPDLRNQNAIDPLRPRVSTSLRGEIRAFLQQLSSGFAELSVDNPVFEEVKVHATVTLKPGKDPGLYLARLREDLIRYLSPWRFDPRFDLHFGASLHSSELINYMDELGYIDYVNAVSLQLWIRDDNGALHQLTAPLDEVHAHTAASVLISSDSHDITLNETSDPCKKS